MSPASLVVLARLLAMLRNLADTMIAVVEAEIGSVAPDEVHRDGATPEVEIDDEGIIQGLGIPTFGDSRRKSPSSSTPTPTTTGD